MRRLFTVAAISAATLLVAACARNEAATTNALPAPQVSVAEVISRPVTEFDEFTGRIAAVERVDIRPRVSGYIASVDFTEGREVHKGDVLFKIDPRPYEAELKRAQADLARTTTALALAKSEHDRATKLLNAHAISQEEFDTRVSGNEQAAANVQAAQAAVDAAALNLSFTRIEAPISGLASKAEITAGNLVSAGQTLLTTLVSIDPVYVEFDGDEGAYLKFAAASRQAARGKGESQNPLWIGLANEEGLPHLGRLVFLDNRLDPATGTIHARGLLDNRDRLFTPGMFARVKLSGGAQQDAVLIKDSAVGTDQSVKYVLVVNEQSVAEYRAVKLGPVIDNLRVVREGLRPGETVVVNGLQRVRPGAPVNPQRVAMDEGAQNAGKGAALLAQTTGGDR